MKTLQRFIELYEANARFVVFDVETVGRTPIIVEIGAVEAGRNYREKFRTFHKILKFCPPSWEPYRYELNIHHIPTDTIENGENRHTALKEFIEFVDGATLICHASFDILAMERNLVEYPDLQTMLNVGSLRKSFVDSLRLARNIYHGLISYSLVNLAQHFAIVNSAPHRGLADAITTKQIIGKLLQHHYNQRKTTCDGQQ